MKGKKSKFSNKYSDRIKSIRESDEKFKQNHKNELERKKRWDLPKKV